MVAITHASCRDFAEPSVADRGSSDASGTGGAADTIGGERGTTSDVDSGIATAGEAGSNLPAGGTGSIGGERQAGTPGGAGAAGRGDGGATGEEPLPPSAFGELALWLEASADAVSRDANERVLRWADRTSNGNDASERPPYQSPTFVEAAINGHAALRFVPVLGAGGVLDPSALMVADSQSLRFGTEDFTYVLVMRWSNDQNPDQPHYSGFGVILGKQSSASGFPGVLLLANYPSFFSNVNAATRFGIQLALGGAFAVSYHDGLNEGPFRVYVARRSGSDVTLHVNHAVEGGTALAANFDASATGQPMFIGGDASTPLRGDIAEIISLKGTTRDADLERLVDYLMRKYQLQ
ncbi:MAG: hypothetical protein ABUL60_05200 [Myxococcales bacterium]